MEPLDELRADRMRSEHFDRRALHSTGYFALDKINRADAAGAEVTDERVGPDVTGERGLLRSGLGGGLVFLDFGGVYQLEGPATEALVGALGGEDLLALSHGRGCGEMEQILQKLPILRLEGHRHSCYQTHERFSSANAFAAHSWGGFL